LGNARGSGQAEIVKGKYDGNTMEIDCASLREIIKGKYD
jgi:hypothetical protein